MLDLILERLALNGSPGRFLAMVFTTVIALVVGVPAAARHNKLGDVGLMGLSQVGIAILNFWFAILLILVFSVQLQWFSAGGFDGLGRRRPCRIEVAAAARPVPGRGAGGHPGAHHPLGRAGGHARGLRAHRARQGRHPARRALEPRAAQRR